MGREYHDTIDTAGREIVPILEKGSNLTVLFGGLTIAQGRHPDPSADGEGSRTEALNPNDVQSAILRRLRLLRMTDCKSRSLPSN
jgi:hypothetical protein